MQFTAIELCAGAGGQALGVHRAGFRHLALVDIDKHACKSLRRNLINANVVRESIKDWNGLEAHNGCDLLTAGLPLPWFSQAGKLLGSSNAGSLFPAFLRHVNHMRPNAIMIENVEGLLSKKFSSFLLDVAQQLVDLGYDIQMCVVDAADFGLAQHRRRVVIVALRHIYAKHFKWPVSAAKRVTVGQALLDLMAANQWVGARAWASDADGPGPTIVGGSRKHLVADLGSRGARQAWAKLGVDAQSLADAPPSQGFEGMPRLTLAMVKRLQGFPDTWLISGKMTSSYRQIATAFPPIVAEAIARESAKALEARNRKVKSFNSVAALLPRRVREAA